MAVCHQFVLSAGRDETTETRRTKPVGVKTTRGKRLEENQTEEKKERKENENNYTDTFNMHTCTAWCSEIGSLTSLNAPELHSSSDIREPISLHQAVLPTGYTLSTATFTLERYITQSTSNLVLSSIHQILVYFRKLD